MDKAAGRRVCTGKKFHSGCVGFVSVVSLSGLGGVSVKSQYVSVMFRSCLGDTITSKEKRFFKDEVLLHMVANSRP